MRIIMGGVPGAGKTTVINKLKEVLKEDVFVVNFGTVMIDIAKERFGITDRDAMRKLSRVKQNELQLAAIDKIVELEKGKRYVIIDTHLAIKTPSGYMPGFPKELLEKVKPEIIVLITARPEEIWERRHLDTSRKRDLESIDDILEHEKINIAYLMAYSAMSGAYALIVRNNNGKLEDAVNRIKSLFYDGEK